MLFLIDRYEDTGCSKKNGTFNKCYLNTGSDPSNYNTVEFLIKVDKSLTNIYNKNIIFPTFNN